MNGEIERQSGLLWETLERGRDHHRSLPELLVLVAGFMYLRRVADNSPLFESALGDLISQPSESTVLQIAEQSRTEAAQPSNSETASTAFRLIADLLDRTVSGPNPSVPFLARLASTVMDFQRKDLGPLLDNFIVKIASKSQSFENYTPQPVVDLMVELADPRTGERIYDPAFGTGGLLIAAARYAASAHQYTDKNEHRSSTRLFGHEISSPPYIVAATRFYLAGWEDDVELNLGDAFTQLEQGHTEEHEFDCILTVPPWGRRSSDNSLLIRSHTRELDFLQLVVQKLAPGGRAVVAVPSGVLFRDGADRAVRQYLLESLRVDGVVALPPRALAPFTAIPVNLLIFRKEPVSPQVRFVVVQRFPQGEKNVTAAGASERTAAVRDVAIAFWSDKDLPDAWSIPMATIKAGNWDLFPRRAETDLDRLQRQTPGENWHHLAEVAQVFRGVHPRLGSSEMGSEDDAGAQLRTVPVVRVSDIGRDGVTAGKLKRFTQVNASSRTVANRLLREGDIVLSVDGTVGKVGIITEDAVGTLASQGVAIIRPSTQVSPGYLVNLLRSREYQDWFRNESRGTGIARLSLDTLRRLPIPVSDLSSQSFYDQINSEAPSGLLLNISDWLPSNENFDRIFLEEQGDDWFEESAIINELWAAASSDDPHDIVGVLSRFAKAMQSLVVKLKFDAGDFEIWRLREGDNSSKFKYWISEVWTLLPALSGVRHIPAGTARYALLNEALLRLRPMIEDKPTLFWEDYYPKLGVACLRNLEILIQKELNRLLATIEIQARLEPGIVPSAAAVDVKLWLKNAAPLPLRDFTLRGDEDFLPSKSIGFLGESDDASYSFALPPNSSEGVQELRLRWGAKRLDGRGVDGVVTAVLERRSTASSQLTSSVIANPYITGSPVDRPDMFFGRDRILQQVRHHLAVSHRANTILLEGNRRSGKSSILRQLAIDPEITKSWLPVECSFQGGRGDETRAGLPTTEIFGLMAKRIGIAVHRSGKDIWPTGSAAPEPGRNIEFALSRALTQSFEGEQAAFEVFELYLRQVLDHLRPRRLLLLLDEFDKIQEGIEAGVTSPIVPENIRYLIQTYPGLAVILSGSRRLKRLRDNHWSALFGLGQQITVGPLQQDHARQLVTHPVANMIEFTDSALDLVVQLCACQPFPIQSLCSRIFEQVVETNQRIATEVVVREVAQEAVRDNEHLHTLWKDAGSSQRQLIIALVDRITDSPDPATLSVLQEEMWRRGIEVSDQDLETDLLELRELELLSLQVIEESQNYKISLPLLREWIRSHVDLEELVRKAARESEEAT